MHLCHYNCIKLPISLMLKKGTWIIKDPISIMILNYKQCKDVLCQFDF